eukprot:402560-Rhodomonas_salina.2
MSASFTRIMRSTAEFCTASIDARASRLEERFLAPPRSAKESNQEIGAEDVGSGSSAVPHVETSSFVALNGRTLTAHGCTIWLERRTGRGRTGGQKELGGILAWGRCIGMSGGVGGGRGGSREEMNN